MTNKIQVLCDNELKKIDRKVGIDAIYRVKTSKSLDLETGEVVDTYSPAITSTTANCKVRAITLTSRERANLANAGLDQVDAIWHIRHAYLENLGISDVRSDHMLTVSSFHYNIIENGASLDVLHRLWTIMTRRRR